MIDRKTVLAKIRSPKFRKFEAQRVQDLIAEGMPRLSARDFARKEIEGRARASIMHSEEQALQAKLEMVVTPIGRPTFRLVYPPAP